jgi:hypothetical protein
MPALPIDAPLAIVASMDFRSFLPLIPAPWRAVIGSLLDRLTSIEDRLTRLEARNPSQH